MSTPDFGPLIAMSYLTVFNLTPVNYQNASAGVVKCSSGGSNQSSGSISSCADICTQDDSQYHLGIYTSNEANNLALTFTFELFSAYTSDKENMYYGDIVKLVGRHPDFVDTEGKLVPYYATAPFGCGHSNPLYFTTSSSNFQFQLFKITTPSNKGNIDGSPCPPSANIALELESCEDLSCSGTIKDWDGNYLMVDESTNGWCLAQPFSSGDYQGALATVWTILPIHSQSTSVLPSEWDLNMYYTSQLKWGDSNYGEMKIATVCDELSKTTCDSDKYESDIILPSSYPGGVATAAWVQPYYWGIWWGQEYNCPYYCKSLWKDQTSNTQNQVLCCSGLISDSNRCNPSYYPQNIGAVTSYSSEFCSGGTPCTTTCFDIMEKTCTPEEWASQSSYIGPACDNYVTSAPASQARDIAQTAIENFYSSSTPTDDSLFVRKAIDLCNIFPGMCDDTLTKVCKNYTWSDLDPQKWISPSRASYDPNGTNLIDTCGCFLPMDQYVCADADGTPDTKCTSGSGRVSRTCNAVCGMPNAVKPSDKTGSFEQCGGATCVIDSVTFNQVDSSSGGFSLTQACDESGPGPYICYLGNDIDLQGSGYGNIEIQQNCTECYIFDPNDTSQLPIRVPCSGSVNPPSPTPSQDIDNAILSVSQNLKWILLIIGIIVIVVMGILLFMYT